MILRFNIQDAVYDSNIPTLCQPTIQSDYTDISGIISINGSCDLTFSDLASGIFTHGGLPCVIGDITVNSIVLVNTNYITIDIDVPNLWTPVDISITLNKVNFLPLTRKFTVFGYDIGKNPNVAITSINPDMYLVMIPSVYGVTIATITVNPAIGETYRIDADTIGTTGNGITLGPGDGLTTMTQLMTAWNVANPTNTGTITILAGGGYKPAAIEGVFGPTIGGTDTNTANVAYANFVGWRKPFTNDLYLYANYSNLVDTVEYKDINNVELANTHIAFLPCYDGAAINLTSIVFDRVGCTYVEVDRCVFGDLTFEGLSLIPAFSCGITCDSCCTDDCLVTLNDNYAQFVIDVSAITPLNVTDVAVVSTEEVTIKATVYDACGNYLNDDLAVVSLNPVPALSGMQIPITFPEIGDYIVHCEMYSDAFTCKKVETFKGCTFYTVEKTGCGNHVVKNLALEPITISVESLNKDKQWDEFIADTVIEPCSEFTIESPTDGVYRITINGEEYRIIVQDCEMKMCFINYTKERVCNPAADCACGGNCGGLCVTVPKDLYDFNAFSILTYNYMALLNDLYIKNFIFTVFQPSDIDRLFTMQQYLIRIKEYCGVCNNATVDTNTGTCGCSN